MLSLARTTFIALVTTGTLLFGVPDTTKTLTLYTLPDVSYLDKIGLTRGHNQDVQPLGIILNKGDTITIEQVSQRNNKPLTMRLYADDQNKEEEVTIPPTGSFTYVAKENVVPLIKTPFSDNAPTIAFSYEADKVKELPTFTLGGNEGDFFQKWDALDASYAFISSPRINMLIPKANKETIRRMRDFDSITTMMRYYQDVIEHYDTIVGLGVNIPNVEARYLVKANKNGAGYMYYSPNHIAENNSTLNGFLAKGWGPLHEIGHGYQGSFLNAQTGDDIQLGEVWNNIFAHSYQVKDKVKDMWLYGTDSSRLEQQMYALRKEKKKYNDMEFQQKLYFFVSLTEKFGTQLITDFYKKYYDFVENGGNKNTPTTDLLVKFFSESAQVNMAPYFKIYGLPISYNLEQELPGQFAGGNAFPALEVLTAGEVSPNLKKLGLTRVDGVLTSLDLKNSGIVEEGHRTLKLEVENARQVQGLTAKLFDPLTNQMIAEESVAGTNVFFSFLPVGSYYVLLTSTNDEALYPSVNYVQISTDPENPMERITYFERSKLEVDFQLKGLGDWIFAHAKVTDNKLEMVTAKGQPHSYFKADAGPYATVTVVGANGEAKLYKEFIGNEEYQNEVKKVPLVVGDVITFTHQEPTNRLVPMGDRVIRDFVTSGREINFLVTPAGLHRDAESDMDVEARVQREKDYALSQVQDKPNFNKEGFFLKYK
jgi:hypothetical protein